MFGQAIQAHDPLLLMSDPSGPVLKASALPNFHEAAPTVYTVGQQSGYSTLVQTKNGVFSPGSTAVALYKDLRPNWDWIWSSTSTWVPPASGTIPGIGYDNKQTFFSSIPVTTNKILVARAQQVQQTGGAITYGWLKYTTTGTGWDTAGTWTFTARTNSYSNSEKYISTFVTNSTDVFCLYKKSTNAIVKYNINTDTEQSPSFSPSLGATSYFKQMMRLPSGRIVAFDPVTTSMYASTDEGITWNRTATTSCVGADTALIVPPTPIGNIVGYLVPPVVTASLAPASKVIQAIYDDGTLSGQITVPADLFIYGISQLSFFKGWWIASAYNYNSALGTGNTRGYRTKADVFSGTVSADWTELPTGITYAQYGPSTAAPMFVTI